MSRRKYYFSQKACEAQKERGKAASPGALPPFPTVAVFLRRAGFLWYFYRRKLSACSGQLSAKTRIDAPAAMPFLI